VPAGGDGADEPAVPADVAAVPPDAALAMSFRVGDVWDHDLVKPVRAKLGKEAGQIAAEMEKYLGAKPEQIERLTLLMPSLPNPSELVLVGLNKPYDKAKVAALAGPDAKEEEFKGHTLFVAEGRKSVGLLGPRAYVIGPTEAIRSLLDRPAKEKEGPLTAARKLMLEKHAAVLGVNVPAFAAAIGDDVPGEAEAFKPLLAAKSATAVLDVGLESKGRLRMVFATAADATKGEKALKAGAEMARGALAVGRKMPGWKEVVPLIDMADDALKGAAFEQDGDVLQASARLKLDPEKAVPLLVAALQKQREAALRIQGQNNLKQIALAMHNYHDVHGRFPPQAVFNKDGKPLLSWRVLLLPYIEQDDLYKQFKLDEPWDSDHNKKLLDKLPPVYAAPGAKDTNKTHYQGFYGKGAFFEGKNGIRIPDITDGTSNTLMVAEAANAVPWSKPEDMAYDPAKPLPKVGGLFEGGFNAAFCDGSVRFLSAAIKPATLHLLIQRNDGTPLPPDF
jgi:prepilin-type processing-associated H-X9-DG protein